MSNFRLRARVGVCALCLIAVFGVMVLNLPRAFAVDADTDTDIVSPSVPLEVVDPSNSGDDGGDSLPTQPTVPVKVGPLFSPSEVATFASAGIDAAIVDHLANVKATWANGPYGSLPVTIVFSDASAAVSRLVLVGDGYKLVYGGSYSTSSPPFSVEVDSGSYDLRFRVSGAVLQFSYRLSNSSSYNWSDYADMVFTNVTYSNLPYTTVFPVSTPVLICICTLFLSAVILIKR